MDLGPEEIGMRLNAQHDSMWSSVPLLAALRLAAVCFFLASIAQSTHAAGIAIVQHASKDAGSSGSSALAFPANTTAGNWIAVCVRAGALNETMTISDTQRNVFRPAIQFNQNADGFTYAIFYAENIAGGADSITVSASVAATLRFSILEYSGVAVSSSLDVTATAQGHSSTPATSPSVTTALSGELLLGVFMTGNGDTYTAGSGYKIEENAPNAQNSKLMVEDQIQSSSGPSVANATLNAADDWAAGLAAFKPAGGTAGAPTVTINQAAGQADPTKGTPINFTVVFSTAVTGFTNSGVTLSGTAGATTAVVSGSGTTYNVAVSGMTQTGTVIATIPAGVATANGVGNTASTSTDNTVTYDITAPTVTINQAASQPDPASGTPINFTVVFSKTVTGFTNSGVTLSGTAGATTAVVSGSGTTYNVAVSGMTQSGTVIATVPAGKATDQAGNQNTASTSTDNTMTFNIAAPSVTINQAGTQVDPTNGTPINFTVVFSTAVTGFTNSGVTLSGTAGATTAVVSGSGTTYNVAV